MSKAFLQFSHNSKHTQIIINLNDKIPKTTTKFLQLCTSPDANYKYTKIHKIISPEFIIQGGNIAGESIFNADEYNKETNSDYIVGDRGIVYVASDDKQTPSTEIFIAMNELHQYADETKIDDFVVLGEVSRGFEDLVEFMNGIVVDEKFQPLENVFISRCGEVRLKKKQNVDDVHKDRHKESYRDSSRERRHKRHKNDEKYKNYWDSSRERSYPSQDHRSSGSHRIDHYSSRDKSHSKANKEAVAEDPVKSMIDQEYASQYNSLLTASLKPSRYKKEWVDKDPTRLSRLSDEEAEIVVKRGRGFKYEN